VYIETSGPHRQGDKAWLVSETIPRPRISTGDCINFYYHMYGSGIGTLNVYVKPVSRPMTNMTLVWSLSGNHDNVWLFGRAPAVVSIFLKIFFYFLLFGGTRKRFFE
jgi:hypothetical protein